MTRGYVAQLLAFGSALGLWREPKDWEVQPFAVQWQWKHGMLVLWQK